MDQDATSVRCALIHLLTQVVLTRSSRRALAVGRLTLMMISYAPKFSLKEPNRCVRPF